MDDLVTGVIIGVICGIALMCLLWYLATRQLRAKHQDELARYDESIVDLRQERSEDKETNRRLRHELAANTPERLVESATNAEIERDSALIERDQALEQLELVRADLSAAHGRITDRETKLREYREALREIRVSLEAQDQNRSADSAGVLIDTETDTGDVPGDALYNAKSADAAGGTD